MLKQRNILSEKLSTPWEKIYGCSKHYIYVTELFLLSIFSQVFYVIIDHTMSAPRHCREFVYGLKVNGFIIILQLISTVQIPGEKRYDPQMVMHAENSTKDVSLSKEFQFFLMQQTKME